MGSLSLRPDDLLTHPKDGFVGWLHRLRFLHPCNPRYGALTLTPVGLSPTEHASLRWTHISTRMWALPWAGQEGRTRSRHGCVSRRSERERPLGGTGSHDQAGRIDAEMKKQIARAGENRAARRRTRRAGRPPKSWGSHRGGPRHPPRRTTGVHRRGRPHGARQRRGSVGALPLGVHRFQGRRRVRDARQRRARNGQHTTRGPWDARSISSNARSAAGKGSRSWPTS